MLPAGSSIDAVMAVFASYQSHEVIPSLEKEILDATWIAIGQTKDEAGVPLFSNLSKVMLETLTIPHRSKNC